MKYAEFSSSDFVADEYFRRWVYQPDPSTRRFWKNWLGQHPEKQEAVEEAQRLFTSLRFKEYAASPQEKLELWQGINQERTATLARLANRRTIVRRTLATAASVGMLLLAFAWVYTKWLSPREQVYTAAYGTTQTIILPDQSTVELNANSTLRITTDWSQLREVWLEGEAYIRYSPNER